MKNKIYSIALCMASMYGEEINKLYRDKYKKDIPENRISSVYKRLSTLFSESHFNNSDSLLKENLRNFLENGISYVFETMNMNLTAIAMEIVKSMESKVYFKYEQVDDVEWIQIMVDADGDEIEGSVRQVTTFVEIVDDLISFMSDDLQNHENDEDTFSEIENCIQLLKLMIRKQRNGV